MKISVVTSVYNRVGEITHAVASVRSQRCCEVEHVVQDGGSTDGTLAILEDLAAPNMKLESSSDGGIYDGINRGIARATGDVIGLMHSDDFFSSHDILERVAHAMSNPEVDGVYGDLVYVRAKDPSQVVRFWAAGKFRPELLRKGWMPPHPTLYLRREVFENWGNYDTDFRIAADYEAILRWIVRGGIRLRYLPKVMVCMRVGGESNRSIARIVRKSREDYRAMRRHGVGGAGTLLAKNITKLGQFTKKDLPLPSHSEH